MRPTRAEINLDNLRHNAALAQELAPDSQVMAIVKANAYGHGAVTIAHALEGRVAALGVACIEEALELRESGIRCPVLLLEGFFDPAEIDLAAENDLWLTVENSFHLTALEAAQPKHSVGIWLKIDTGMHRLGVNPDEVAMYHARLQALTCIQQPVVLTTHFASADDLGSDQTRRQLDVFKASCEGIDAPRSAANSPGTLGWPASRLSWVRPGYMLYGNSPFPLTGATTAASASDPDALANAARLRPVMTLKSAVIGLRDVAVGESVGYGATWTAKRPSRIATVTIGYGDGYPRLAPNGTPVLINGQRAPLAGRVSMDMITVDVSDLGDVGIGDEVVLWGEGLGTAEIANSADTIGYELTTRMPARVARVIVA